MQRIVVAAKAGVEQPWLTQAAAELAAQSNAVVDVVSADDLDVEAFSTIPRDVAAEPAERSAEAIAEQLRASGIEATANTQHGPVVRSVLLFAEDRDADLIVCGASARGPVARRLLGDTSVQLIRPHAARPRARLPRPVRPRVPPDRDGAVHLPDGRPAGRDVVAVPDLDGDRPRHLLRLWHPTLAAEARRGHKPEAELS